MTLTPSGSEGSWGILSGFDLSSFLLGILIGGYVMLRLVNWYLDRHLGPGDKYDALR